MNKRSALLLVGALVVALTLAGSGSATATNSSSDKPHFFVFHAGDGAVPDVSMAADGRTVTLRATGTINTRTSRVSGVGLVLVTRDTTTLDNVTLTVQRLLDFDFYGCGTLHGTPLPPFFCGGTARLAVEAVVFPTDQPGQTLRPDGVLTVICEIGKPPPSAMEGIKLRVEQLGNFNQQVSGTTLFVKRPA
jgi:hypothetical protein